MVEEIDTAHQKIYLITVFENLENEEQWDFSLGCRRSVGFVFDFETAENIVQSNMCDIWETCYDYACIEELPCGLYPIARSGERTFYQYNQETNGYEQIEEPTFMRMKSPVGRIG